MWVSKRQKLKGYISARGYCYHFKRKKGNVLFLSFVQWHLFLHCKVSQLSASPGSQFILSSVIFILNFPCVFCGARLANVSCGRHGRRSPVGPCPPKPILAATLVALTTSPRVPATNTASPFKYLFVSSHFAPVWWWLSKLISMTYILNQVFPKGLTSCCI